MGRDGGSEVFEGSKRLRDESESSKKRGVGLVNEDESERKKKADGNTYDSSFPTLNFEKSIGA